jgi:tRNA modification GTPase
VLPSSDTIIALATPPGRSGIGVIRISGPGSLEITRKLVGEQGFAPESHHSLLKTVRDLETGEVLDQALITYFKAPHSFTGEEVVELSCHGSPVLLRSVIDSALQLDARMAGAGEFTLRALSNGKLNLSQAEAIRDLIDARTNAAARQAVRQMGGELSLTLQPIKEDLIETIVLLESALEFVEDDLAEIAIEELYEKLIGVTKRLGDLSRTYKAGRLLRDGLKVTIAGRPNVGKSSLFNKLLEMDRAIVSDLPGTTRDSLSELINISGVPVLLTDTAGVRSSADKIETLGVERTRRAIADADLIIVVLDGSEALTLTDQDTMLLEEVANHRVLVAINKSDLSCFSRPELRSFSHASGGVVTVSAITGAGLDVLRAAILEPFEASEIAGGGLLITDSRHFDLLRRSVDAVDGSRRLLTEGASEELVLVGLHNALRFLGEITGETTPDEILGRIFSTFCIGK